jgi:hypothetical protein
MRKTIATALSLAALSATAATPQIALQVGATRYAASGKGECKSAPEASIHGVKAAMYSVVHRDGPRALSFTLWQPRGGPSDVFSLNLSDGTKRHDVDTVKLGTKRDTRGSGKASVAKKGKGATFTLDAVTAGGDKVTGTIECTDFGAVRAEGG